MIEIIAVSLLMRIKGGGHGFIRNKTKGLLHKALDGKILSTLGFFILCLFHYGFGVSILAAIAWLAGVAPSIGEQIGAVGGYKRAWRPEGMLWGWKSGMMRGTYQGALLALATGNTMFIIAGALFPLAYFIGVSLKQLIHDRDDWDYGEWIYGAILGFII